jgi:hypothetical protein
LRRITQSPHRHPPVSPNQSTSKNTNFHLVRTFLAQRHKNMERLKRNSLGNKTLNAH